VSGDIVGQIRKIASRGRMDDTDVQVVFDAADEIERLRAERDAERALADQLADAIFSASIQEAIEKTDDALAAYDEARRG
jgi:hypothetical protein